jgi:hypothetical protein
MLAELIGAFVSLVWLPGYSTSATTDVVGGWPASEPSTETGLQLAHGELDRRIHSPARDVCELKVRQGQWSTRADGVARIADVNGLPIEIGTRCQRHVQQSAGVPEVHDRNNAIVDSRRAADR